MDTQFNTMGPFKRVNNDYSILDKADLVMIDPVGTGFSRPVGDAKGDDFWGVDDDIRSVSNFIARWVTEYGRWESPKFLLGEMLWRHPQRWRITRPPVAAQHRAQRRHPRITLYGLRGRERRSANGSTLHQLLHYVRGDSLVSRRIRVSPR
jgi:hypothetical protein